MAYQKTTWVDGQTPAINSTNLNHIEQGIYDVDQAISGISVPEVKTTNTTSDTSVYSCTYTNNQLSNKLNTSAVKTTNTTSDTNTYSCTYVNNQLNNKLNTSAVKTSSTTSNSDVYSCTYVNDAVLQKYSTTETKVGTWTDNKPIYRKVINITSGFTAGETTRNHNISNFKNLINVYGMAKRASGDFQPIPAIVPPAYQGQYQISVYDVTTTQYKLFLGSNIETGNLRVTELNIVFEYTKTTD